MKPGGAMSASMGAAQAGISGPMESIAAASATALYGVLRAAPEAPGIGSLRTIGTLLTPEITQESSFVPKPGFHSDRCERARAFLLLPG